MTYSKDIIEIMNNDEKCKGIIKALNEQCADHGISPNSEEYRLLREMTTLRIIQHHEGIQKAIARNVYNDINKGA